MNHRKKNAVALLLILLAGICALPSRAAISNHPSESLALSAQAAVLYEANFDKVLLQRNADRRLPMASTTKIMTALAAVSVLPREERIPIPREAVGVEGSSAYLTEGEILTVEQLIYALLLQSANDAAVALAIAADGSVESFVSRMNQMASDMGLTQTHFMNPHGLHHEDHYTTAYELALIAKAALQQPFLREVLKTKRYTAASEEQVRIFVNHNKLLFRDPSAIGVKTGFTKASGRCLVGAAEAEGLLLISVTLNAPSDWSDHETMWRYACSAFTVRDIAVPHSVLQNIPVSGALYPFAVASNRDSFSLLMRRTDPIPRVHTEYEPVITAPIKKGDVLGYLVITQNGKELARLPLQAENDMPRLKSNRKWY